MTTSRIILLLLAVLLVSCRQPQAPDKEVSENGAPPAARGNAEDGVDEGKKARKPGQPDFELNARDATATDASIVQVRLSNQGNPERNLIGAETSKFLPTDTVYASVETSAKQGGYTLYAKWIANDGSVLSEYGTRVAEAGAQRTVVSLSKPDGWASGDYRIELAINSQRGREVGFKVQ
jgi:hypothetical protein